MESLPADLLTRVLEYVLIPERLNLARCNTTLMHAVTRDCPTLWTTIDFALHHLEWQDPRRKAMKKKAAAITDEMLAAFLTRVNAIEVVKSLKLQGCVKLVGSGLEPLRGSQVLERINLRVVPSQQRPMDEVAIMDILRTMFPFNLFDVVFQQWYWMPGRGYTYETKNEGVLAATRASFYRDMHSAKRNKAIENGTLCHSCSNPVVDTSNQVVPSATGPPSTQCFGCDEHFCHNATCSVAVKGCKRCGRSSCDTCEAVHQCGECLYLYCSDCYEISSPCNACQKRYCDGCRELYRCDTPGCDYALCEQCNEGNESFLICEMCEKWFCHQCDEGTVCNVGEESCCRDCIQTTQCFQCDRQVPHCEYTCTLDSCPQCERSQCSQCKGEHGSFLLRCVTCGEHSSCSDCNLIQFCQGCHEYHCRECKHFDCKRSKKKRKRSR